MYGETFDHAVNLEEKLKNYLVDVRNKWEESCQFNQKIQEVLLPE